MFRKMNMKWLLIIFGGLVALVLVVQLVEIGSNERSFDSRLVKLDTTEVSVIDIQPKDKKAAPIKLTKKGTQWMVESKGKSYKADPAYVSTVLKDIAKMQADRVAGSGKDAWQNFELADTNSTHVVFYEGDKKSLDLYIGKFTYTQNKSQMPQQMQGGGGVSITTYIRLGEDEKVFAVNGFFSMYFNRDLNTFRDKRITGNYKETWNSFSFTYNADSSFVIKKKENKWSFQDGTPVDSAAMEDYINTLAYANNADFADDIIQAGVPTYKIKVEAEGTNPYTITASLADTVKKFVLSSELNSGVMFADNGSGLVNRLFKGKKYFQPKVKK